MAGPDHNARARRTQTPRKPINELGRPHWVAGLSSEATGNIAIAKVARELAHCATLAAGIRALSLVLCNNQAFRDLQDSSDGTDERQTPLHPALTEGLFAALCKLSEQSELDSMGLLEDLLEKSSDNAASILPP